MDFTALSRRAYTMLKRGKSVRCLNLSEDVIRIFESAWGLPKTGKVSELEYNFPAHHLTPLSSKYYSDPIYRLILAIRDGDADLVMTLFRGPDGDRLWSRLYEGEYLCNGMKFGPSYEILDYVVTRLEIMIASECNDIDSDRAKAWSDARADVMIQYFEVAVAKRDLEKLKSLFNQGYDGEFFPVREACRQDDLEILVSLDQHFGFDRTVILQNAFFYGQEKIVRRFWNISHEARKDEYLTSAVRGGRLDAVLFAQTFLKMSITIDMCIHVATKNATLALLRYFEDKFGDAFIATMTGESLWSSVACSRDKKVVLYAISKGFNDWLDPVYHNLTNQIYYDPSLILLMLVGEDQLDKSPVIKLAEQLSKTMAVKIARDDLE